MMQQINKRTLFVAVTCLFLGAFLGAFFHKETIVVREGVPATPAALSSVNLMIDYGDGGIKTWNTVSWSESFSPLALLERVAAADEIHLMTKESGGGRIVDAIDNVANDATGERRWQYWVNNNYEPRIASKYSLKPGDIVLWKFVKEQPK